jgi:hypothetical protein
MLHQKRFLAPWQFPFESCVLLCAVARFFDADVHKVLAYRCDSVEGTLIHFPGSLPSWVLLIESLVAALGGCIAARAAWSIGQLRIARLDLAEASQSLGASTPPAAVPDCARAPTYVVARKAGLPQAEVWRMCLARLSKASGLFSIWCLVELCLDVPLIGMRFVLANVCKTYVHGVGMVTSPWIMESPHCSWHEVRLLGAVLAWLLAQAFVVWTSFELWQECEVGLAAVAATDPAGLHRHHHNSHGVLPEAVAWLFAELPRPARRALGDDEAARLVI